VRRCGRRVRATGPLRIGGHRSAKADAARSRFGRRRGEQEGSRDACHPATHHQKWKPLALEHPAGPALEVDAERRRLAGATAHLRRTASMYARGYCNAQSAGAHQTARIVGRTGSDSCRQSGDIIRPPVTPSVLKVKPRAAATVYGPAGTWSNWD
jgi:hypothetical protein